MSVTLENVRLADPAAKGRKLLFDGLSLEVRDQGRVGILGAAKSGMGVVLRLLCGTTYPDAGRIRRNSRVSWPIPLHSYLVGTNSLARNVRFIARLYGIDDEDFPRRVVEMVELSDFVNTPLAECPKHCRGRLAFAIGIALDFDIYLFEGAFAPVDKPFKEKGAELAAERTEGRGVVVATSLPAEVERNCESVYVLEGGHATYFSQAEEGVQYFKKTVAAENKKQKADGRTSEEEEEDVGMGDIDILGAAVADVVD